MADKEVVTSLLVLFDTLSREFHSLNSNYDKIQATINMFSATGANVSDVKQLSTEINKELHSTKEIAERMESAINELLAYKNSIAPIPADLIELTHNFRSEVSAFNLKFDDEFFNSIKDIKDVNELKKQLEPIVKFSKLIVKPTGIITFIMLFVISLSSVLIAIYKIFELFISTDP